MTDRSPDQYKPINEWLMVIRDENPKSIGSIILTETLPFAANIAYYSGKVFKIGQRVCDYLNVSKEELFEKKVVFRQYLSDVICFKNKIDNKQVFLLHAKDVELLVDNSVKVELL
jgi:hypothetical protein